MNIILKEENRSLEFAREDLPMLIHGIDGSGASLFSLTVISNFVRAGNKILFLSAYPMAKDELERQTSPQDPCSYVEHDSDIDRYKDDSVVVIRSGNSGLMCAAIQNLSDTHERIIFIKNIETVLTEELFEVIKDRNNIILSGDVDKFPFVEEFLKIPFKTKIFFSKSNLDFGVNVPQLPKYEGYLVGGKVGFVGLEK